MPKLVIELTDEELAVLHTQAHGNSVTDTAHDLLVRGPRADLAREVRDRVVAVSAELNELLA